MINKRERMLALLDDQVDQSYIPAAFFLHFDPACHRGQAAVDKHLEYFHATGMDFVKIQFENPFPVVPEIQAPADWAKLPIYGQDFYQGQLDVVEGLVKAAKDEALIIMTLYSPYMVAQQAGRGQPGVELLDEHLGLAPELAKVGVERAAESLMIFVRACIDLGVDGFYASTQGAEQGRFGGSPVFDDCIKPSDLMIMDEMNNRCPFNILHVCDYHLPYADLAPFVDYPGDVVNVSLELAAGHRGDGNITAQEVAAMFGRPFMGGLDRLGAISSGDQEAIRAAVGECLANAPARYILGADCTVPGTTAWDDLKLAIDLAHQGRG